MQAGSGPIYSGTTGDCGCGSGAGVIVSDPTGAIYDSGTIIEAPAVEGTAPMEAPAADTAIPDAPTDG